MTFKQNSQTFKREGSEKGPAGQIALFPAQDEICLLFHKTQLMHQTTSLRYIYKPNLSLSSSHCCTKVADVLLDRKKHRQFEELLSNSILILFINTVRSSGEFFCNTNSKDDIDVFIHTIGRQYFIYFLIITKVILSLSKKCLSQSTEIRD